MAAQTTDTLEVTLPPITVEATRSAETSASAPFAVAVVGRSPVEVSVEPASSLQDVLAAVPGLWINDRGHFAMGERITIRGTGWRSAFGVRGVMVVLDGVPLTMPDGQAFADIVEPSLIRSAEVIRGPAAVFWGNASGGVVYLKTRPPTSAPLVRLRGMTGSFGERQLLGEAFVPVGRGSLSAFGSHVQREGHRRHSQGNFQRGGLHFTYPINARTLISASAAGAVQDAQNPGGLTAQQVAEDRRQVHTTYLTDRSGKESIHLQSVVTVDHTLSFGTLSGSLYGVRRDLDNPLPGRYVEVDRLAGGARLRLTGNASVFRWSVGGDAGRQVDDRFNFENIGGEPGPDPTLEQIETVANVAAYGYLAASPIENLEVSAGVRGDAVRFEMDDQLLANRDESGSRNFQAFSPTVGIGYHVGSAFVFGNFSTAFETPTTTELVNRPDATGGFNPALDPEYTRGFEIGIRGAAVENRIAYEAAVYRATVENVLVQHQTEDNRDYYRNAGRNRHLGSEATVTTRPIPTLELLASYSWNHLRFLTGELEGNELPGVPEHRGYLRAEWTISRVLLAASLEAVSAYYADELNEAKTPGYELVTLRVAHTGIDAGTALIRPFVEVENVLDEIYNASVVVNAFGGRFYEPGAGRSIRAGLSVQL